MKRADIPTKFSIPFANAAGASFVRNVPVASQIGITNGAASLTDGFPPLNATPRASGGVPPFIQDMNGILRQSTNWLRWVSAGGPIQYDAAFQTSIGGYPRGALVASTTVDGLFWYCTTDDNLSNPNTGGAGWMPFLGRAATSAEVSAGVEELKVVTPKSLADAGVINVTSSNLTANLGHIQYSNGLKECWGQVAVAANGTATVTLPIVHTSWFRFTLGISISAGATSQDNNGWTTRNGLTGFTLRNRNDTTITFEWMSKGV